MDIYITSRDEAPNVIRDYKPQSIISFIDEAGEQPIYQGYNKERHLCLYFNDIPLERSGLKAASRQDTIKLIEFFTNSALDKPILIHCLMGVSRSVAAAYIMLCLHNSQKENELAQYLRMQLPHAYPNPRLIEHADDILGREGRMINAIRNLPSPNLREAGKIYKISTDFI